MSLPIVEENAWWGSKVSPPIAEDNAWWGSEVSHLIAEDNAWWRSGYVLAVRGYSRDFSNVADRKQRVLDQSQGLI